VLQKDSLFSTHIRTRPLTLDRIAKQSGAVTLAEKKKRKHKYQKSNERKKNQNFRHQLFIKHYLSNGFNGAKAAVASGFSVNGARRVAVRLLNIPWINEKINEERARILKQYEVTPEKVVEELAKVGFSNMQDYIRITPDGGAVVDLSGLNREQAAAIQQIESEVYMDYDGERDEDGERIGVSVKRTKLKLADKKPALDTLAKYTGVLKDTDPVRRPIRIRVVYEDAERKLGVSVEEELPVSEIQLLKEARGING
jgi:phage terminase small subunit